MIVSIILFTLTGWGGFWQRLILRIVLMPLVAGITYELIKWLGRTESKLGKFIAYPGLKLQELTTKEPDDEQLEVAIKSLMAAEGIEYKKTIGELLIDGNKILKEANIDTYILDVQLLLGKVLGKDKLYLITNKEEEVSKIKEKEFYKLINQRKDKMPIKYILKSAVPLFAAVFFYTFYQKITVIFISSMYSDYASGIYSAAARLTEIWYMVPAVLMTAFFPAIVKAKQISEEEYKERIKTLFYVTTIPLILMALFAALLSPFIIKILYGEKYIQSSIVLALTIWSVPFISFYVISSKCFIIENKLKHLLFRSVLSFILIIILNYILGSLYYLKGFSAAVLISSFISFFLIDLFFKDTKHLFFIKLSSIFLPFIYILNLLKKEPNNP